MAAKRFRVIVNPQSGALRGPAILEMVKPLFAGAGAELEIHSTARPGHAGELARTLDLTGCAGLCVIGGDGTLHEAVNGLMLREHPAAVPLGVIPGGTGNSVAEHLGLTDTASAARRILSGGIRPLDVARVRMGAAVSYCINIIGWGLAVDVNRTAERLRFLGHPRYNLAALWQILRRHHHRARLTLDGRVVEDDFAMVVGCNTRFTGKGMMLAPGAEADDGLLDVVVIRRTGRRQILKILMGVYDGSHIGLPQVEIHRVRSFTIEPKKHDQLNLDGEIAGATPVEVELLPAALKVFG